MLDWISTNKLNFRSKVDDHHIFPVAFVKAEYDGNEKAQELVDCIVNRTLIPKITNIKIGKKSPSNYLSELSAKNPDILKSIETHLLTNEIMETESDVFFLEILENRAKKIFDIICNNTTNKTNEIISQYYDEEKFKKSGNIEVYGTYRNKKASAKFNIETQTIFYKEKSLAVSTAADMAKFDISGNDNISTNGWTFWKWKDEDGEEYTINDFRKKQSAIIVNN